MTTAYINRIATAVPPNDVHEAFVRFAQTQLQGDRRSSLLFRRMAEKGGIDHRYSYFAPAADLNGEVLEHIVDSVSGEVMARRAPQASA